MIGRAVNSLRWRVRARFVIRAVERHSEEFATHMPVLVGLAQAMPVRSILELGSGLHSTPLFLNREIFPDVERVLAVEDEPEWSERVRGAVGSDQRLELRTVDTVAGAVTDLDPDEFDLVLIDDSSEVSRRAATIRAVAAARGHAVVVIHDIDLPVYRAASRRLGSRFIVRGFNPQTAVFGGQRVSRPALRRIRRAIDRHAATVSPTDTSAWRDRFAE